MSHPLGINDLEEDNSFEFAHNLRAVSLFLSLIDLCCLFVESADDVSQAVANAAKNGDEYFSIVVDKNTDFNYMYDRITKANQINSDSPKLNDTCNMLYDEKSNLITFQLEYIN